MAVGGVRLEERLDVVGCSPVHRSEGQYQGLESDTGCDGKPVEGDEDLSTLGSCEAASKTCPPPTETYPPHAFS